MNNKKGLTALVLSGGGSRGAYQAGAWQALAELGIDIDMVTGTSVGAINGAMVCQGDLDLTVKLWKEIETHMVFDVPEGSQPIDYAKEIVINHGAGTTGLRELLEKYIDEDKVRQSSMDYGLVVVETSGFKVHRLFKDDIPRDRIIDYVLASSSVFPAVHACEIDGKDYIDGGYVDVLPIKMAVEKGADRIIAVKLNAMGILDHESFKNAPNLTVIESKWNLGNTLIFDVNNARRIMRLGYLDTMRAFGVLDGTYYAFSKNAFSRTDCRLADACAHIFDMDPAVLYTRSVFMDKLSQSISLSDREMEEALSHVKRMGESLSSAVAFIKDIKNIVSQKTLCFLIADSIKDKGADSIFVSRAAIRLMPEQVAAARFLAKYNLI